MNPKETVLQSHKKEKLAEESLRKAVLAWQKQQLLNAMERLFNFLEAIEKRRLAIMQHFDNDNKTFDIRLTVTVMLNPQKGCIDVCLSSGIVIGSNSPTQPLNLFWGMEKLDNELSKFKKTKDLHTSKINIPIFDDIIQEINGEICDYIKENPVNYIDLGLSFRNGYTYRTKEKLDEKTVFYECGINNYTTLS